MNIDQLEYVGGGYFRQKGATPRMPSPIMHAGELLKMAQEYKWAFETLFNAAGTGEKIPQEEAGRMRRLI